MTYSFKNNPSLQDLEDIADWMRSESKIGNYKSISKAWAEKALVLIKQHKNILGFCAFESNSLIGKINVLEVKENFRRQKLGTYLCDYILEMMKSKNIERVEIFVPDSNVVTFWKKMGFKEIIKDYDDSRLDMYKKLKNK